MDDPVLGCSACRVPNDVIHYFVEFKVNTQAHPGFKKMSSVSIETILILFDFICAGVSSVDCC